MESPTEVDQPSGSLPFPNGTRCFASSINGAPELLIEAMSTWPRGIYAMDVMAQNPADVKVGTWTFDIIESWYWGCFNCCFYLFLRWLVLFCLLSVLNSICTEGWWAFAQPVFSVWMYVCLCVCVCVCVVHPPSFGKLLLFTVESIFTLEGHYLGSFSDCTSRIYHISSKDMSGNFLYAYIETDIWFQRHWDLLHPGCIRITSGASSVCSGLSHPSPDVSDDSSGGTL